MQIPVNVGFGQVGPQGGGPANIPSNLSGINSGAYDVSSGSNALANSMQSVANDMAQRNSEMARAKASNALLDHEIAVKTTTEDIHNQIQTGAIPYKEGQAKYAEAISKIQAPVVEGLDPAMQENYDRGIKRLQFGGDKTIAASVVTAQRADFKGQWGLSLDKLGKLGGFPGADIDKINEQATALVPLARAAGLSEAEVTKQLQDFKDQNWTNHATQSAIQNSDNLDGLKQVQKDLTSADGFYANKLDANKRNAILSTVTSHIIRLENRANTLADKADALAEKTVDKLESDVMTGIPVSENRIAVDATAVKGTQHQARFDAVLQMQKSVTELMAKPITEQDATIKAMQADLAAKGSDYPARDKKLLDTLQAASDNFKKTLDEQPLQAIAMKTGMQFAPLTPASLSDPKQIPGILKDREAYIGAARKQFGDQVQPKILFSAEADMVKKSLENMSPTDQKNLLAVMKGSMSGEAFRATMDQIGADGPMKLAGISQSYGYKTTEGRDIGELLLQGRKLLKDSTTLMPKEKSSGGDALAPAFNEIVGNSLPPGEKSREYAYSGVKAIYAVLAKEEGKNDGILEPSILKRAVNFVTGGIVDYNGSKVIPPYGMAESTFLDKTRAQIDGLKGMSSLSPDELRKLPIESTKDGYVFRNGRNYVPGKDGKPLTFKVNQ